MADAALPCTQECRVAADSDCLQPRLKQRLEWHLDQGRPEPLQRRHDALSSRLSRAYLAHISRRGLAGLQARCGCRQAPAGKLEWRSEVARMSGVSAKRGRSPPPRCTTTNHHAPQPLSDLHHHSPHHSPCTLSPWPLSINTLSTSTLHAYTLHGHSPPPLSIQALSTATLHSHSPRRAAPRPASCASWGMS